MATVTGVTAARANEIEDKIIVSAEREGTSLVFTTDGGTVISVDNAFPALYESYPVGSIYMSDRSANPSTYMGGGTWVRWGKGRVPVSVDEAQTEFDTVEETGGAKTHALTVNEIPSHNHGGVTGDQSADHSHTGYTGDGPHEHNYLQNNGRSGLQGGGAVTVGDNTYYTTGTTGGGSHTHAVQTYGASNGHTHSIGAQGGGAAHNNLQPYINVFMWKRTA